MGMSGIVIRSYGLATLATALVSASHFLLQVAVLRALGAAEFGLIAFVLTLIQFGTGLSNAFVAAPFAVVFAKHPEDTDEICFFYIVSILTAVLIALLTGAAVMAFSQAPLSVAVLFAGASAMFSMRWFGRSEAYAHNKPVKAALSDLVYSITLLLGAGLCWLVGFSLLSAAVTMFCAASASLLPFGLAFVRKHRFRRGMISAYRPVWVEQARWALVGLVTTEATANAHAYIVTALAGPAAFAPLAAAMLFLRPVGVCIVSLTQLERPVLARTIASGQRDEIVRIVRRFAAVLLVVALGTIVFAAGILAFAPGLIFKPGLQPNDVVVATAIWSVIVIVACIQAPLSVMLQAGGLFRALAHASIHSCGVTILLVVALVYTVGPVYSALGVLAGQLMMTAEFAVQSRRFLARFGAGFGDRAPQPVRVPERRAV